MASFHTGDSSPSFRFESLADFITILRFLVLVLGIALPDVPFPMARFAVLANDSFNSMGNGLFFFSARANRCRSNPSTAASSGSSFDSDFRNWFSALILSVRISVPSMYALITSGCT